MASGDSAEGLGEFPSLDDADGVRKFFEKNGFVAFPALLTNEEVDYYREAVDSIVDEEVFGDGGEFDPKKSEKSLILSKFVDKDAYDKLDQSRQVGFHFDRVVVNESTGEVTGTDEESEKSGFFAIRSVINLFFGETAKHGRAFGKLAQDERLVCALRAVIGDELRFFNSRAFYKMPGSQGTAWHRDIQFFPGETKRPIINLLVFLDEHTSENGGLRIVPGSHVSKCMAPTFDIKAEFGIEPDPADTRAAPSLPGEYLLRFPPGTVVLLDHFTLHGSSPNLHKVDMSPSHTSRVLPRQAGKMRRLISLGYGSNDIVDRSTGKRPQNICLRGNRTPEELPNYAELP